MYEFTRLKLTEDEFNNLVFMGPPGWWINKDEYPPCWDKEKYPELPPGKDPEFLEDLCYNRLEDVVNKVIDRSDLKGQNPTPTEVFKGIDVIARGEKKPWFERHAFLSQRFEKGLMDKLWIRNLAPHERKSAQNRSFYTEDGNHRALVYALYIELTEMHYEPVDAIHATSWDIASGILGHLPQPADVLEHNGELQYNSNFKEGWTLSNGIRINTYKKR